MSTASTLGTRFFHIRYFFTALWSSLSQAVVPTLIQRTAWSVHFSLWLQDFENVTQDIFNVDLLPLRIFITESFCWCLQVPVPTITSLPTVISPPATLAISPAPNAPQNTQTSTQTSSANTPTSSQTSSAPTVTPQFNQQSKPAEQPSSENTNSLNISSAPKP